MQTDVGQDFPLATYQVRSRTTLHICEQSPGASTAYTFILKTNLGPYVH